jgi:SHS2 domain-containing protein
MGHRFIDHTADVAADLEGGTPGQLFLSAARALTDTMTPLDAVAASVTQAVTLQAPTLEDLLVDWLNELVYRFEVQDMLYSDGEVVVEGREGRWFVTATLAGERFDPARHPMRVLVKSATYHGLHVVQDGDTWRARIVLDI